MAGEVKVANGVAVPVASDLANLPALEKAKEYGVRVPKTAGAL